MLRVGSLFSGIGGIDLGFERAGMEFAWGCEIDKHPKSVLNRHWPDVPIYGDVCDVSKERLEEDLGDRAGIDVLVGGFPCQDLSVAGKRAGLGGDRSGLFWQLHRVAREFSPTWVVAENVPGLLSSNGGADFWVVQRALVELGYSVAWRVLNAQHFGVPQRRRRVFIVGCLGDPRRAAEVLFEQESCRGDSPPHKEAGQEVAGTLGGGSGDRGWSSDTDRTTFVPTDGDGRVVSHALTVHNGYRADPHGQTYVGHGFVEPEISDTVRSHPRPGSNSIGNIVAHGFSSASDPSAYEDTAHPITRRKGDPGIVAYGIAENQRAEVRLTDQASALSTGGGKPGVGYPVVLTMREGKPGGGKGPMLNEDVHPTLNTSNLPTLFTPVAVRRLVPVECERLQGFPDGWTEFNAEGEAVSDSARYKMLGNSVAVPVLEWIGRRMVAVENG